MNRLLALLLPIIAVVTGTSGTKTAPHDLVGLSQHWGDSVQAETAGKYDEALQHLQAFGIEGGDTFMTHLRAGWLYSQKAEYVKASEAYATASKIQPTSITPLLGLLAVAQSLNEPARIERAAEALLRAEPTNYKGEMALANVRFAAKDYRRALNSYRRVLKNYPEDNDAASGAAWSASYVGETREALVLFTRILSLNPAYPSAQQGFELCGGKSAKVASRN